MNIGSSFKNTICSRTYKIYDVSKGVVLKRIKSGNTKLPPWV
jgi:hypothetical protein